MHFKKEQSFVQMLVDTTLTFLDNTPQMPHPTNINNTKSTRILSLIFWRLGQNLNKQTNKHYFKSLKAEILHRSTFKIM